MKIIQQELQNNSTKKLGKPPEAPLEGVKEVKLKGGKKKQKKIQKQNKLASSESEDEYDFSDFKEKIRKRAAERYTNSTVTRLGSFVYKPSKRHFKLVGYNRVLQKMCINHIGKTLGSAGVEEDLRNTFEGTAE